MKTDIYSTITDQIIAGLEKGAQPWFQPWRDNGTIRRPLRADGIPYQGVNVIVLWAAAMERGYTNPTWMTFKKAQELGGTVRKGETGTHVVYCGSHTVEEDGDERQVPFLKAYSAFNVQQIDGLPERFYSPACELLDPALRIERAERFFANTGAVIREGDRAAYNTKFDFVSMPPFGLFRDAESHAATLAHEIIHWTGSKGRTSRDLSGRFGDSAYAMEEMIAEIGAAYLCADLDIRPEPSPYQVAYIASWIKVLRRDKRAIFTASSMAGKAVEYLHGLQPVTLSKQFREAA